MAVEGQGGKRGLDGQTGNSGVGGTRPTIDSGIRRVGVDLGATPQIPATIETRRQPIPPGGSLKGRIYPTATAEGPRNGGDGEGPKVPPDKPTPSDKGVEPTLPPRVSRSRASGEPPEVPADPTGSPAKLDADITPPRNRPTPRDIPKRRRVLGGDSRDQGKKENLPERTKEGVRGAVVDRLSDTTGRSPREVRERLARPSRDEVVTTDAGGVQGRYVQQKGEHVPTGKEVEERVGDALTELNKKGQGIVPEKPAKIFVMTEPTDDEGSTLRVTLTDDGGRKHIVRKSVGVILTGLPIDPDKAMNRGQVGKLFEDPRSTVSSARKIGVVRELIAEASSVISQSDLPYKIVKVGKHNPRYYLTHTDQGEPGDVGNNPDTRNERIDETVPNILYDPLDEPIALGPKNVVDAGKDDRIQPLDISPQAGEITRDKPTYREKLDSVQIWTPLEKEPGDRLLEPDFDFQNPYFLTVNEHGLYAVHRRPMHEPRSIVCMDEGVVPPTPQAIRLPGPSPLFADEITRLKDLEEKGDVVFEGVYSHRGCGAAALEIDAMGETGIIDPEKAAQAFAKKIFAPKLTDSTHDVPYKGHLPLTKRPEDRHIASVLYIDGRQSGLDISHMTDLPTGFVVSGRELGSRRTIEYGDLALTIAFGAHGRGSELTQETPFHIVGIAENEGQADALQGQLNGLRTSQGEKANRIVTHIILP